MTTRTLVILRHARAEHGSPGGDAERALTPRGVRDARRAGKELATTVGVPDQVLCSPAVRTRQTWEQVRRYLAGDPDVSYERGIYDGDSETLFQMVSETDEAVRTVLLIGHNPDAQMLVWALARSTKKLDGFRPGSFAVLELPGAWAELWAGECELTRFWTPRATPWPAP